MSASSSERQDKREKAPVFRSAEAIFRPRTVAIVGASETGGDGWPKALYENMRYGGFPAKVYLVNPRRRELWDQPVYPDLTALPEPVDLALMVIPAEAVPASLEQGAAHGLQAALLYAARFGEGGDPEGAARAQAIKDLCERSGVRVCGPNCMGALSVREQLLFYPSPRIRALPPGPVGVVFQSGGTFQFWLQQAAVRGLGFSYAVSSGNELDLDLADYVNFLIEDKNTRLIACMVEGIRRPNAFMAVAEKALAAGKPLIMVKVGRSDKGKAAARSHTGALAGDDKVFDAVCRKYGIVRCPSLDDLIETALAFQFGRLPEGKRIAMAGYSGGAKGLFLDYATAEGAEIAELSQSTLDAVAPLIDPGLRPDNPLDTGAGLAVRQSQFSRICQIIAADEGVDILTIQGQLPLSHEEKIDPKVFADIVESTDKPVLVYGRMAQNVTEVGRAFQEKAKAPFIQGLPETVRALQALIRYGECRRQGILPIEEPTGRESNLEGATFEDLLRKHGLQTPASAMAATPAEAATEASRIGFPVALKIVSPQASHKTEVGGVQLNLIDGEALARAAEAMAARLKKHDANAEINGFLVQEMVRGVELILGVREDPQFGPLMIVGLGGVLVEAIRDFVVRLLPVSTADGREMLGELRGSKVLGAFRGQPARDVDAAAVAIAGLSQLFLDHRPWVVDLEVNPLMVLEHGKGVRAVDVRQGRKR
jgi:acyl-CoA synthetase (NDP forming)